nr:unnamed protein product [Mus musculus]
MIENDNTNSGKSLQRDEVIQIPTVEKEEEKESDELTSKKEPAASWSRSNQWWEAIQETAEGVNGDVDFCIAQSLSVLEQKIGVLTDIQKKLQSLREDLQKKSQVE